MKNRQARIGGARAIAEVQVKTWQTAYQRIIDQAYLESLSVEWRTEQWCGTIDGEVSQKHGVPIQVLVTESEAGGVDGVAASC